MLRLISLIAFCVAVVAAQEHHHCQSPLHFKAAVLQYDHLTHLYRRGVMLYDGEGERLRFIEETAENDTRPTEDILILFREKKEFVVDMKTKKCEKKAPSHEFHRIGVQEGFNPLPEFMIGDHQDGVLMTACYRRENSTDMEGITTATYTRASCLPYEYSFEGTAGKEKVHYHRRYYDIVVDELNHEAFAVPKECASSIDDFILP